MRAATHNGVFHADDAVGGAILRRIYPGCTIERTRDHETLERADIRFDVGGKSDGKFDFDHHQKGGAGERPNGVRYAAAGLLWKVFGVQFVEGVLKYTSIRADCTRVADLVDTKFVQVVDAGDNGQKLFPASEPLFEGAFGYSFAAFISSMNPTWVEERGFDEAYRDAADVAFQALYRAVLGACAEIQAEGAVRAAISTAEDPRLVILSRFLPWQDAVISNAPEALFVAFPSETGEWMLQCIPPEKGSFDQRKPLPAAWAGLRADAFCRETGVGDGIFCHPNRHLCGARSREGVMTLAKLALAE